MANSDTEVIREFLVSLGFEIDQGGLKKFVTSLSTTKNLALTCGKAVLGIAVAAEVGVTRFASQMEKLYYASRRTSSTVDNLQALEYGSRRIGLAAGAARESLEAMAANVRLNPGLLGMLKSFGVDTNKQGVEMMIDLVQRLSKMPHFVGARFAQMFGIDEQTFLMLKQGMPELLRAEQERKELGQSLGVDAQKAAEASHEYMNDLRSIGEKLSVIGQKWAVEVLPYVRDFNKLINESLDKLAKFDLGEGLKKVFAIIDSIKNIGSVEKGDVPKMEQSSTWSEFWKWFNSPLRLRKGGDGQWRFDGPTGHRSTSGKIGHPTAPAAPSSPTGAPQSNMPLGLRQNNPGNLRTWQGAKSENGFAKFETVQDGLSAMAKNLLNYGERGLTTIRQIISAWAPAADGNNVPAYIADVMKQVGVGADAALNLRDPETLARLMDAIIRHEQGGVNPVGSKELVATARQKLGGQAVTINQKTDIHVAGTNDPQATGRAVAGEQGRVNGDIVRNFAGAAT